MPAYTDTDQRLHLVCQVIAKANRTFVPRRDDDSHTNLAFDAVGDRILGRWISAPAGPRMLAFHLGDQAYQWLGAKGEVLLAVPASGKRSAEAEMALVPAFREAGLAGAGFTEPLHYQVTDYPFAADPFAVFNAADLDAWRHYRTVGQIACGSVLSHVGASGEPRIWPHHFDTGVYAELPSGLGLGFGWAMEDAMAGEPYLYASGYRNGKMLAVNDFAPLTHGRWVGTEHWKGALLPLSALPKPGQGDGSVIVFSFIEQAVLALQA